MSQENVEAVRAGYDALNRRDYDAWVSMHHPDIELHELATSPDSGVYRGYEGLREWLKSVWDVAGDGSRFEPEEFRAVGDRVFVSVRAVFISRESAIPIEGRLFHVIEMSHGRARRISGYLTEEEALGAAGLSG